LALPVGVFDAANAVMTPHVGARIDRARRALTVTRVARRSGIRRVLAEIGVRGHREATPLAHSIALPTSFASLARRSRRASRSRAR
jgi:hypothetical protein